MSTDKASSGDRDLGIPDIYLLIRRAWLPALTGLILFGIAGMAISFVVEPEYRVEVVLEYIGDPTKQEGVRSSAGGIGGLAALAGISVGSEGNPKDAALALMQSWQFLGNLIEHTNLAPVLYSEDWDDESQNWLDPDSPPNEWRTIRRFRRDVFHVSEDPKTGLVSLYVTLPDPELATEVATAAVSLINTELRESTLHEAVRSIEHLESQLAGTQNIELQRAVATLLQAQIESLMFADIREEFAFRTIDAAVSPPSDEYVYPSHIAFGAIAGILGGLILSFVWILRSMPSRKPN